MMPYVQNNPNFSSFHYSRNFRSWVTLNIPLVPWW
jgi:hypothetical protein